MSCSRCSSNEVLPRLAREGLVARAGSVCAIAHGRSRRVGAWRRSSSRFSIATAMRLNVAFCAHQGEVDCRVSSHDRRAGPGPTRGGGARVRPFAGRRFYLLRPRFAGARSSAICCASQEKSLAVAETATGGLLAQRVHARSVARASFSPAVSCAARTMRRMQLLDVPECLLLQHGAVSDECAVAMATGAAETLGRGLRAGSDGICRRSITGRTAATRSGRFSSRCFRRTACGRRNSVILARAPRSRCGPLMRRSTGCGANYCAWPVAPWRRSAGPA